MHLFNQPKNKFNILPTFAVATFGLHLLALGVLMFHGSMLQRLGGKLPQSLIQLIDGRAITVTSQDSLERNPETIRRFVGEIMTLMFTWSEKMPPQYVWDTTSIMLSSNLQQKFQSEFLEGIPVKNTANTPPGTESLFIIRTISQPEQTADGQWLVEIIANRIIFTRYDKGGQAMTFRKKILVQAVETQAVTLPDTPIPLHSAVYRLGEARLEISNICDVKDKNC
jgi:hypothetical protein